MHTITYLNEINVWMISLSWSSHFIEINTTT